MTGRFSSLHGIWQRRGVRKAAPWLLFGLFLLAGWRNWDLFGQTPAYGDVAELMGAVEWYRQALASPELSIAHSPYLFHPDGWYTYSFPFGPGLIWLLLPLTRLAGPAFAYNGLALLALALAFAGMRRLAGRQLAEGPAVVAGLLYTFWGFHWLRLFGHLNILLGGALLPWIVYLLDGALSTPERRRRRLIAAGLLWALALANSLQFVWIGGFVVLGWVGGRWLARAVAWRPALTALLLPAGVAAGLNLPYIIAFQRARAAADVAFHNLLVQINWSASLNAFAAPAPWHPWLGGLAGRLYGGPANESAFVGFGLLGFVTALLLAWRLRRARDWWPALLLAGLGLLLAMGPYLQWSDQVVTVGLFRPLNVAVWRLGSFLKPGFFYQSTVPADLAGAVPLPGLALALFLPLWEGARTVARYAVIAAVGIFPLLGAAVARLPRPWQRLLLAALLLAEAVPWVLPAVPFPPPTHPAQEWIAANSAPDAAVLNLFVPAPDRLSLSFRGEIQASAWLQGRAIVSGPSSMLPARTAALQTWLTGRPDAWRDPQFLVQLHDYQVDYVLLHVNTTAAVAVAERWPVAGGLALVDCFPPPPGESPWPYDICVYAVPESNN